MDIYSLLKKDHEEVLEMLDELMALSEEDDYRMILIEQIVGALVPHSRAEESVFYNAIRSVSESSEVMHGFKEHVEAEGILRLLQMKDKTNLDWRSSAKKLREALQHHINEEESKIFAEAKRIFSAEEASMMGDAFEKMKEEVAKEGFMKTSFDLVKNLMPPRFVEKMKSIRS